MRKQRYEITTGALMEKITCIVDMPACEACAFTATQTSANNTGLLLHCDQPFSHSAMCLLKGRSRGEEWRAGRKRRRGDGGVG